MTGSDWRYGWSDLQVTLLMFAAVLSNECSLSILPVHGNVPDHYTLPFHISISSIPNAYLQDLKPLIILPIRPPIGMSSHTAVIHAKGNHIRSPPIHIGSRGLGDT